METSAEDGRMVSFLFLRGLVVLVAGSKGGRREESKDTNEQFSHSPEEQRVNQFLVRTEVMFTFFFFPPVYGSSREVRRGFCW